MAGTTRLAGASLLLVIFHLSTGRLLFSEAQVASSEATVYANVIDNQNKHVAGLGIADLFVKEDGVERPVISAEPATAELQVAILVDDNGTGIFRFGLNALGEMLQGRAAISLTSLPTRFSGSSTTRRIRRSGMQVSSGRAFVRPRLKAASFSRESTAPKRTSPVASRAARSSSR